MLLWSHWQKNHVTPFLAMSAHHSVKMQISCIVKLEVCHLSKANGGPELRVLYMHSAILSLLPFASAHVQVS